jgi:hypothetical protein
MGDSGRLVFTRDVFVGELGWVLHHVDGAWLQQTDLADFPDKG